MTHVIEVNTTYEPFSLEPEYVEANRGFLSRHSFEGVSRLLDLACGAGTVSELLLDRAPSAHLNGVDLDPVQIGLSSEKFRKQGYEVREGVALTEDRANGKPVLTFGVGSADELPFPDATFDCVTIANAIHLLPDKAKFLKEVQRVLKPGGAFGFNTTFYAGSIPPGEDAVYFEWLQRATDYIKLKNEKLAAQGLPTIKRKKGTVPGAFRNRWQSPAEWSAWLSEAGLTTVDTNERRVEVDARGMALVGAYGGLAQVLLSGYPVEAAGEALQVAAQPAMEAVGIQVVPRNYLELWSRKS